MTCLHCGAINKDTANFCKDCGMKFTTQKEQDIGTHEDRFYEIAMEELESRSYIKGIWAKAFSQSNADEAIAKALYIKFRVQSLKEEFIAKQKLEEEKKTDTKENKDSKTKNNSSSKASTWISIVLFLFFMVGLIVNSNKTPIDSISQQYTPPPTVISNNQNKAIEFSDNIKAWTDKDTGLMWEVKTQENIKHEYVWKDAFLYAEKLNTNNYAGFNDWRVPTFEELKTLLTKEKNNGSYIKYPLLKNNNNNGYWSSTTRAYGTVFAWDVYFSTGDTYYGNKAGSLYVRCVRGGQ